MGQMVDMSETLPNEEDMNGIPNEEQFETNPFDTNFDAGVEANEEEDPKHYIEQLSGKLSQSLRSYQKDLVQPDTETAKYAAGMVIKAAIEGLTPKDKKDILSKLDDNEDNVDDGEDGENENIEFDGLESVNKNKMLLDELFQDITQVKNNTINDDEVKHKSYRISPFTAPNLK